MTITCNPCGRTATENAEGLTDLRGWAMGEGSIFCPECGKRYRAFCEEQVFGKIYLGNEVPQT